MLEDLTNLDWISTYALPWGINVLLAIGTLLSGAGSRASSWAWRASCSPARASM